MRKDISEEEMKLEKKKYYREYRKNNREKMRKAQQKFWCKKVLENRQKQNEDIREEKQ